MSLYDKYFEEYRYSSIPSQIIEKNKELLNNNSDLLFIENITMNKIIDYRNQNSDKNDKLKTMSLNNILEYYKKSQYQSDICRLCFYISKNNSYEAVDKEINKILNDPINKMMSQEDKKNKLSKYIIKQIISTLLIDVFSPGIIEGYTLFLKHIINKFNIKININFDFDFINNIIIKNYIMTSDSDKECLFDSKMKSLTYILIQFLQNNIINNDNINTFINDYICNIDYYINEYNDFINYNTFYKHIHLLLIGYSESTQCNLDYDKLIHINKLIPLLLNHPKYNEIKQKCFEVYNINKRFYIQQLYNNLNNDFKYYIKK